LELLRRENLLAGWETMGKRVLVKYKAHLPEITKKEEEWIECADDLSMDSLLQRIAKQYQGFSGGEFSRDEISLLTTLNGEFIPTSALKETLLKDGDVIVLLPPVSGG
jgi:molybdopterin converting factor small subunit